MDLILALIIGAVLGYVFHAVQTYLGFNPWYKRMVTSKSSEARASIWRSVLIGNYSSVDALCLALRTAGYQITDIAEELMESVVLSHAQRSVGLVTRSVRALGFPDGAIYSEVIAAAEEQGLALCQPEYALYFRLYCPRQPKGEHLIIAMAPLQDWDGYMRVFTVCNDTVPNELSTQLCPLHSMCRPDETFVFFDPIGV